VARWVSLPGSVAAHPPDRGHRQASGAQRAGEVQGAWPLRCRARDVPDGQANRAARPFSADFSKGADPDHDNVDAHDRKPAGLARRTG
jgi:hypothetical protein